MPSPLRSEKVFADLPLPPDAAKVLQGGSALAAIAVPDAFKVVPDHLKGQKATNELSRPPLTEAELDALLVKIPSAGHKWYEWNNVGLEIYESCKGADYGLDAWERWSRTDPAYATADTGCDDAWKRFHSSPPTRTGAGALVNKARAGLGSHVSPPGVPPSGGGVVNLSSVAPPQQGSVTSWVTASPLAGSEPEWTNIPPREWLYGVDLVRGEMTVVASPGGVGKSALVIGMVMSLAFEKDLLGETIWDKGHKVLYINGEDNRAEIRRRTLAFGMLHNIPEKDMKGRLFIFGTDSWQTQKLNFLRTDGRNFVIDEESFAFFETLVAAETFSAVVIDPLINFCGGGNVNDNAVMAQVMRRLKQLAAKYRFAGGIIHHNRKGGDAESQESVSGAASTVNLSRRTLAVIRMTTAEANEVGVMPSECWRYLRVVATKTNMSPPTSNAQTAWYEMVGVSLNNGNAIYPSGDKVHAVKRAKFTPANKTPLTMDDKIIRKAILDVAHKGKVIAGETHPYTAKLDGSRNQRGILTDAMDAVKQVTPQHQWPAADLEAVVTRHVNQMLTGGWLAEYEITHGRFRRRRGLKVDWPKTLWPDGGQPIENEVEDEDGEDTEVMVGGAAGSEAATAREEADH